MVDELTNAGVSCLGGGVGVDGRGVAQNVGEVMTGDAFCALDPAGDDEGGKVGGDGGAGGGGVLTMRVEEEGEEEMRAGRAAEVAGWRRWSWGGITP